MEHPFEINKYMGKWYELMHYPSFFQKNDNYNTTAEYTLNKDNTITICNSTMSNGKLFSVTGKGIILDYNKLNVSFDINEINKISSSPNFSKYVPTNDDINYVIEKLWINKECEYLYAVVSNCQNDSLYVLSRCPNPPLKIYNEIMNYVTTNFNRDRLVQTPHFK